MSVVIGSEGNAFFSTENGITSEENKWNGVSIKCEVTSSTHKDRHIV